VSYVSDAQPIKMGYLFDFVLPDHYPQELRDDLTDPFKLVFQDGLEQGVIDRPIEIVFKEVEGLPKGGIKPVLDAYAELVEEGCVAIFGPAISDNCEPTKAAIEERFKVPALTVTGSEAWLGPWTFALPMGSLTDEPLFWAQLIAKRGITTVGVVAEQSVPGETYARNFRSAARRYGIRIVAEEWIAQVSQDATEAVKRIHDAGAEGLVHCGFGYGVVGVQAALRAMGWDPPRFMGTAFQNAWLHPMMWDAMVGWTGVDQYDESNQVGQDFLDRYQKELGRRPEYCVPVVNRDMAMCYLHAIADARPLTPLGVRDALERVKMLPAASGAPGTHITFGNYMHRGWVGSGYLVARELNDDGITSRLVDRFGAV
jgi:ABC-type branched-subunit amino acid transport system substrate-binding protein